MSKPGSILIVEDDATIVELLTLHLNTQGYKTESHQNGNDGLRAALGGSFDLIILDVMLPGLDGLSICRKIREQNPATPILMLTAKTEEIDKIVGLEIGADDYITKPFSIRELVARVRAALRRMEGLQEKQAVTSVEKERNFGSLRIDFEQRTVYVRGEKIEVTSKEFELLSVLSDQPGKAFSRQELLELVWGYQYAGYSHTVNSHINRLRSKIEIDPGKPTIVETVWGFGYRLASANGGAQE